MTSFPEKIENLIREDYDFKFGNYISESFDIVQKKLGLFIAFIICMIAISMIMGLIPDLGIEMYGFTLGDIVDWLLITPCLMAGFYLAAYKIDANEALAFGDFFEGFNFAGKLVVMMIFQSLLMGLCLIPYGIISYISFDTLSVFDPTIATDFEALQETIYSLGGAMTLYLLCLLPVLYLYISWTWAIPFVIFYDMEAWPAMEASRQLISKHWLLVFAYFIVGGLIVLAGALLFLVGMLFTLPVCYVMSYTSFKDVTRLGEEVVEDDISKHLVV